MTAAVPAPRRIAHPLRVSPIPVRSVPPGPQNASGVRPVAADRSALGASVQGELDLALTGISPPRRLRALPVPAASDDFGPRPTPTRELPDGPASAARIGLSLLQVAVGARPAGQVARFVAPEVYDGLVRRQTRAQQRRLATRRPMRVRRVVSASPRDGVLDASLVIDDAQRVRALSLRLVGLDGRWLVTELVIG